MWLRFTLSFLAFVTLAALIWWLGPIVSVGSVRPLEAGWVRAIMLACLFLIIFAPCFWQLWRTRRAERALRVGLTHQQEQAQAQQVKLVDTFNQAIQTLKKHQSRRQWYESKPGLYELPWYVFVGPPGSGKTTALRNAGLRFPLQDTLGADAIKGVGGTRNCDWWFSDEAVLIDTAGRFTTQDSDANTDAVAWQSFLALLKKHRPKQPLNGVLLTLSALDLMESETRRQECGRKVSLRLQEMIRALGVCPPVYVLITKIDLLTGFKETFGKLSDTDRAQAWGINFEHPNHLPDTLSNTITERLDELQKHLQTQLNGRLEQEHTQTRRVKLFEFPLAFAQFKPALLGFLQHTFQTGQHFEHPVMLRGVYLCSGTQDGSVFDRLLSGMGAVSEPNGASLVRGKSFFIERLLKEVVFAEQHLASYVKKKALLEKLVRRATLVCGLGAVLGLNILWWFSHGNNAQAMAKSSAKAAEVQALANTIATDSLNSVHAVLSALTALRHVTQPAPEQMTHHMGLNQDKKMLRANDIAYQNALAVALMPHVAQRLEDRLRAALFRDPELSYESLKAYLMIHEPAHFDAKALSSWVVFDWEHNMLKNLDAGARAQAIAHLRSAIELGPPAQIAPKDTALIDAAREVISRQSPEERLYQRMIRFHEADTDNDFTLIKAIGANGANVFTRTSGKSLNVGVPALYTKKAYMQYFLVHLPTQAELLRSESPWVLNDTATGSTVSAAQLLNGARALYLQDYIDQWDTFLQDVQLQKPRDFDHAVDLTRTLAPTQSPLKKFLEAVSQNTQLATPLKQGSEKAEALANQQVDRALSPRMALLAGSDLQTIRIDAPMEQRVDDHFRNINELFDNNAAGYAQVSGVLNNLYTQLAAISAAKKSKSPPPPSHDIQSLATSAGLMPEPVRSVVGQLASVAQQQGRVAERASLNADLRPLQEVCMRTIANRYPIHSASGLDVLSEDFSRFFGPGGSMDIFFQTRLNGIVDTGSSQWTLKPTSDGHTGVPSSALVQFQRAARIRDVFFAGQTKNPAFDVEMRLIRSSNPNDVFYMENNGELKMFSRQFEPSHRVRWTSVNPSATLRIRASEGSYKTYTGPWALFRMLDASELQGSERPEKFITTITLDGKRFEFEVLANSALNPLRLSELRQFKCPGQL